VGNQQWLRCACPGGDSRAETEKKQDPDPPVSGR
jgi:hypothetical protein